MGMQTYQFVLVAGQEITPPMQNITWVSCNGAIDTFEIAPDSSQTVQFFNGAGLVLDEPAKALRIKNGATPQTIVLNCGNGSFIDNRIAGAFTISGGVQSAGNSTFTTGASTVNTAAVIIIPASGSRSSVLIQNNSPATDIYVGTNTVTTATGIKVGAGGSMTINTRADVYAIASAAGADVRTMRENT